MKWSNIQIQKWVSSIRVRSCKCKRLKVGWDFRYARRGYSSASCVEQYCGVYAESRIAKTIDGLRSIWATSTIRNVKIISLNVGLPREVSYHGRLVETGNFKSPISGPVMARTLNFDGDQQADLSVHGGVDK